jgi:hypothetical protein
MGTNLTSIGYEAFYNCSSLTDITIPNSVTSVGDYAFNSCSSATNLTVGKNVTNIGAYAFAGCSSLTDVTIGRSVTNIGDAAFAGCTILIAITVDTNNPAYSSVAGVLFNKNQTALMQCPGGRAGGYTIPNGVTSIGIWAFAYCPLTNVAFPNSVNSIGDYAFDYSGLTSVAIPNSVTSLGDEAFDACWNLISATIGNGVTNITVSTFSGCTNLTAITVDALNSFYSSVDGVLLNKSQTILIRCPRGKAGDYTIPNSVTSIGDSAFGGCKNLTRVTIGNSVTNVGGSAFWGCKSLTGVCFEGNAPSLNGASVFSSDSNATVYYLPGTSGWGTSYGFRPTALWVQVPTVQTPPQTQTTEMGAAVSLWVEASSPLPLFYLWRLNDTNLMSWSTNHALVLPDAQISQAGAYTVVISNVLGAVTSAPAMLNVVAAVERRPVWGVKVTGESSSLLNVDYAESLRPTPNWTTLNSVSLTSTSQYSFDLTLPIAPQRFYRSWQTGTPGVRPSLELHLVPAITLTGTIGHSVRLDYINQFGPTDAWVTLDTVTLTNTSQLYFDTSAPGQPQRLYRLVPLP